LGGQGSVSCQEETDPAQSAADGPHRDLSSCVRGDRQNAAARVRGYENATNEKGEWLIWLDPGVVDRLRVLRGPGKSYSDAILRLASGETH
jgi:hypothetical protein